MTMRSATVAAAAVGGFLGVVATIVVGLLLSFLAHLWQYYGQHSSDAGLDSILFIGSMAFSPVGGVLGAWFAVARVIRRRASRSH